MPGRRAPESLCVLLCRFRAGISMILAHIRLYFPSKPLKRNDLESTYPPLPNSPEARQTAVFGVSKILDRRSKILDRLGDF